MQKHFILLIIIALSLVGAACEPKKTGSDVIVEIRRSVTGLHAEYHLPEATTKFELIGNDQLQRQDGWTVEGEGWDFDGIAVTRTNGKKFDSVTFNVTPEKKFYDRKYVVLDRIGDDSWMLYITAFSAFEKPTQMKFMAAGPNDIVRLGANRVREPGSGIIINENGNQQAYFGQKNYVDESEVILIAGPTIPEAVRNKIAGDVGKTIRQLSDLFGERPLQKPTLYITTGELASGWGSKGGLLGENVMTFHYRGIQLDLKNEKFLENVSNTAAHEATHSWLGGLYKNHRNEEESWAHEGGAEYLADRTRNNKDDIQAELEMRLNRCIEKLGDRALDGRDGYVQGVEAYDCGYVLNAFAEAGSIFQSNGSIAGVWNAVFDNATFYTSNIRDVAGKKVITIDKKAITAEKTDSKGYKPKSFIRQAQINAGDEYRGFANLFLEPRNDGNWSGLEETAEKLGVTLETIDEGTADARALASLWLFPFLGEHCSNGYGYFANEDHFHLDTGKGCVAAISGKPKVISAGSYNLITAPYQAYTYAKEICVAGGDIELGLLGGGKTEAIQCTIDVKPIPPRFTIKSMPDLLPL